MNEQPTKSYGVLIAEDSATDRWLIKSAIGRTERLRLLAEVPDGTGVLAYLQGRGEFSDREKYPMPHLLLLDLNMPQVDGFQVLEWLQMRTFPNLMKVVLTDSLHGEHLKRAMDLGADFFQVKPRSAHELQTIIRGLESYLSETPAIADYATSRLSRLRNSPAASRG
jgi:CheY-like chemotaxis protein